MAKGKGKEAPAKVDPRQEYEQELQDKAGQLHNLFVAHISEVKLPPYLTLLVLDLLREECLAACKKKYLGG